MTKNILLSSLCTALFLAAAPGVANAAPAHARQPAPQQAQANIPLANFGSIYDWRAEGDQTLYIEDIHHNWYKATLFGYVPDLDYTETIGFVPEASGSFNKFSAVIVRGQQYPVKTFEKVESPPATAKKSHKNTHKNAEKAGKTVAPSK